MINRLVFAFIVSTPIVGSPLVISSDIRPKTYNISVIVIVGYIGAGIFGFWLLVSTMKSGRI